VRGLPLLHVGQVVAHELAHAWLFESKVMESGLMARQEQEAFCDMASYLWLSAQLKKYEVEGDPSKIREASVRAQMFEKRLLTAKDGREFKALVKKIAALPQGNGLLTVAEDLRSKANAQFNA
jgi:predicted SprT family Zn-dependent metalloprotease